MKQSFWDQIVVFSSSLYSGGNRVLIFLVFYDWNTIISGKLGLEYNVDYNYDCVSADKKR